MERIDEMVMDNQNGDEENKDSIKGDEKWPDSWTSRHLHIKHGQM